MLVINVLILGVNFMIIFVCFIGDKVFVVYCYVEKVVEILREYYIEFVKNNINLL